MTTCKTRDWNKIIKKNNHLSQWNSQDDDVQTPYLTVSAKLVKGLCMQGEYKSFCSWFDICHRCVQIQSVAFRWSDPADRSSFWQLYGVQEGKKALSGHTLRILSLYLVALTLYPAEGVYKDLKEDTKWEGLPALFCIFYKFICHIRLSMFWNWKNPTSET